MTRWTRLAAGLVLGAVLVATGPPAWAWFADSAGVTSAEVATTRVVAPATVSCAAGGLTATISWPEVDPRDDYEVVLRRVSTGAPLPARQVTGSATSTTYTGLLDFGITGLGTVDFVAEVRSYLAGAPTWRSSDVRTSSTVTVLALAVGATVSC